MFKFNIVYVLVFPVLLSSCSSLIVDKSTPYPGLETASETGYVEMWVPTSFGMWMKDLEQGPTNCDNIEIDALGLEEEEHLCMVKELAWPSLPGHVALSSLNYRPIADNFSACRFPMPAGKHTVLARPGIGCYPESLLSTFQAGGYAIPGSVIKQYKLPVFVIDLEIQPERLHSFILKVLIDGDEVRFFATEANTTLPIPANPQAADPDPASFNELVKMLESELWEFRWYAARRLGFIGNKAAIPVLRAKLGEEKHLDVQNELTMALERLN